jgi:hypothetical protein
MTIRIEVTNPAEHQPSELRAVATFLQNLAADRESGRIQYKPAYQQVGDVSLATHLVPHTNTQVSPELTDSPKPDAPGASSDQPAESAVAQDEPNTSPPEVDSNGLPWDERIHSSSKALNADRTWRYKRGGDLEERKAVEEELRASLTPATADDQMDALVGGAIDEALRSYAEQLQADDEPPAPPVDDTPPPPPADEPAAPVATDIKLADVVRFTTQHKIPFDEVAEILKNAVGVEGGCAGLFKQPELAGAALEALKAVKGIE